MIKLSVCVMDDHQRYISNQGFPDYDKDRNRPCTERSWFRMGTEYSPTPVVNCGRETMSRELDLLQSTAPRDDKFAGVNWSGISIGGVSKSCQGCSADSDNVLQQDVFSMQQGEWKFGNQHGCCCSSNSSGTSYNCCHCNKQGDVLYYESNTPGKNTTHARVEQQRKDRSQSDSCSSSINNNNKRTEQRSSHSLSPGFQEGIKSMLYWHLIGSYQNLNQLSDTDCGDLLVGLRDQGSLTSLNSCEDSLKLISSKDKPCSSVAPSRGKDKISSSCSEYLVKSDVTQSGIGYQTFCTCWIDTEQPSCDTDTQAVIVETLRQSLLSKGNRAQNPKVCKSCGKYLQNRYLSTSKTSSRDGDENVKKSSDKLVLSDSIPTKLLKAKPVILANPQLQELNETLTYLRDEHSDEQEKKCKIEDLDKALDYLTDMVTESTSEQDIPENMTAIRCEDEHSFRLQSSKTILYFVW